MESAFRPGEHVMLSVAMSVSKDRAGPIFCDTPRSLKLVSLSKRGHRQIDLVLDCYAFYDKTATCRCDHRIVSSPEFNARACRR
jgi:hypothetical protein